MISANEWWAVLINYNENISPFQWIWGILAIMLTLFWITSTSQIAETMFKAYLSISFFWIAIAFFLILGTSLPPIRFGESLCFLSLGTLFGYDTIQNKKILLKPEQKVNQVLFALALIGTFSYPLLGLLIGHVYPQMIIYGTFPCPTAALALAVLMWSIPNFKWHHWIIILLLLIWAIPFPIFIQIPRFKTYEDIIMLTLGLITLLKVIFYYYRNISKKKN